MKRFLTILSLIICVYASFLSDTTAIYTKTLPAIHGTVTAIPAYEKWDREKELNHRYKIGDIVEYNGHIYKRKDSGTSGNHLYPDKNKSWVLIL